jgi:cytochrome c peroxidase
LWCVSCHFDRLENGKKSPQQTGVFTYLDNIAVNRGSKTVTKTSTSRVVAGIECGNFVDLRMDGKRVNV